MKKALIVVLSVIMSALLMFGIVACGDGQDNTEKVNDALETIRILYDDDEEETAASYKVIGRVRVGEDFYPIEWTVSSQTANYQEYISIGEMDPNDDDRLLIEIKPGDEKVEYTLKATVTIGKSSNSIEFAHYIPAASNVLSVAEAIELANGLEKDAYYMENNVVTPVLVKGYIVDAGTYNSQYGDISKAKIADEPNGETTLLVYTIDKDDVYNTQEDAIEKGDLVTLRGPLQNYKGNTPELTYYNNKVDPSIEVTVVALVKPEMTDAERVAKVKEAIDLSKNYNAITEVTLPSTKSGATLSWAVKDATDLVKVEDGKLKVVKLPTAETLITLTVTITSGSVSDTKDIAITVAPTPTEAKVYKASEAQALGETLAAGKYYEENGEAAQILVQGYVIETGTFSTQYSNWTGVYIADTYSEDMTKDSEGTFLVYRIGLDGTYLKADGDLEKGDLITVKGYLQNYKGDTVELTYPEGNSKANPVCVALEKPSLTDEQKVERALNGITLPATVTKDVELPASGVQGVELTYASDNAAIKIENGKMVVTCGETDVTVKITATATINSVSDTKEFTVVVKANVDTQDGTTVTVTMSEYASKNGWVDGNEEGATYYDTVNVDDNVMVTVDATPTGTYGRNSGKYYDNKGNGQWRIYQNETPSIVFTAKQGYKILTIKITYDISKTGVLTNADKTVQYASGDVIAVDAGTVTFTVGNTGTATNGQVRITAIEVVYRALSADEHEHVWSYAHVEGSMTHKVTCTVEGCSETQTSACEPELNVCNACSYEYSATEILNALFALEAGNSLSGSYRLSGEITAVDEISTQHKNATFTIKIGEREVIVFRAKGEGYETIKVGDTVTVTGALKNYSGKYEFDSGCKIIEIVPGTSHVHEYQYTEKDADTHTVTCTGCNEVNTTEAHEYDNAQDTTCNKCGYVRTIGGDPTPAGKIVTTVMSDYAAKNSWENSKLYDTVKVDENVTVTVSATPVGSYGCNSGKYYSDGGTWRIYQNETPSIVFTAKQGYKILTIKITYSVKDTGILTNADKPVQYASDEEITVNAGTVTFSVGNTGTVTKGKVFITKIEVVYGEDSGSDPTPPTPHQHVWSYAHVENTWTHTKSCTAEGCDVAPETVDCVPALNVCPDCNNEYTEAQILTALFALEAGKSLPGTYRLSGEIIVVDDISVGKYNNATFTIKIGEREVIVFRAKGENYTAIRTGDTVTVTGVLKNYSGKYEFDSGCTIIEIVQGTHEHKYSYTDNKDGTTHTAKCVGCIEEKSEAHVYGDDTICDNCKYVNGGEPTPDEKNLLAKFELGENGEASHYDGKAKSGEGAYTETQGSYTLNVTGVSQFYADARDAKGNSCFKLGTGKAVGSFSFSVSEDVKQVIVYVAIYKTSTNKASISVNGGDAVAIASDNFSNDGKYFALVIDTSTVKDITISTVSGATRCMINTIEFKG